MYTLTKHKKRGTEGFKDFVKNLELFPSSTVSEMIFRGLLEDPVYMRWALKNRTSFEYFLSLEIDDVLKVFEKMKSQINFFVMAFKNTEEEEVLLTEKLPTPIANQYKEEADLTKVTQKQRTTSRIRIMETCFELEKQGELPKIQWDFPPSRVVDGELGKKDDKGIFTLHYLDETLALKGPIEKGLRAGKWEHYYPNGKLLAVGIYVNGEKNDFWSFYYPNGKKQAEGYFREDRKHGEWTEYGKDGSHRVVTYSNGKEV